MYISKHSIWFQNPPKIDQTKESYKWTIAWVWVKTSKWLCAAGKWMRGLFQYYGWLAESNTTEAIFRKQRQLKIHWQEFRCHWITNNKRNCVLARAQDAHTHTHTFWQEIKCRIIREIEYFICVDGAVKLVFRLRHHFKYAICIGFCSDVVSCWVETFFPFYLL